MIIRRDPYLQILRQLKDQNLIKVITGLRRVGKSTLLHLFQEELRAQGIPASRLLTYNFEDPAYRQQLDWGALYDEIISRLDPTGMNYVFLDEVQMVPTFERLVDGLFIHPQIDLYITGSNAFLLSGELATLLSGRYLSLNLLPLSLREYQAFHPSLSERDLFERYLQTSSLPGAVSLEREAPTLVNHYLLDIFDTVINKDIKERYQVQNLTNFKRVTQFVLDSVGSFISPANIAETLNSQSPQRRAISHKTVEKYLSYLTDCFFLYPAQRYDLKGRQLLKTRHKYFVVDLGFRRALVSGRADADLGHKLENLVYLELRRRNLGEIWVGKQAEHEVDFVVQNPTGERSYYQVAWSAATSDALKRELRSLEAIKDNFPKFLLTTDPGSVSIEGIQKLNVVEWLL